MLSALFLRLIETPSKCIASLILRELENVFYCKSDETEIN